MDPLTSPTAFFMGHGSNKGLMSIAGREGMSLAACCQAVQKSDFPEAYAKHEATARTLVERLLHPSSVGTADHSGILASHTEPGKDTAHLQPSFASSLVSFIQAAPGRMIVFSGYRSPEHQAELFNSALRTGRAHKWVAAPGDSRHEQGLAVDLHFESAPPDNGRMSTPKSLACGFQ